MSNGSALVSRINVNSDHVSISPQNVCLFYLSPVYNHPLNIPFCGETGDCHSISLSGWCRVLFPRNLSTILVLVTIWVLNKGSWLFIGWSHSLTLSMLLDAYLFSYKLYISWRLSSMAIPLILLVFMLIMDSWILEIAPLSDISYCKNRDCHAC